MQLLEQCGNIEMSRKCHLPIHKFDLMYTSLMSYGTATLSVTSTIKVDTHADKIYYWC